MTLSQIASLQRPRLTLLQLAVTYPQIISACNCSTRGLRTTSSTLNLSKRLRSYFKSDQANSRANPLLAREPGKGKKWHKLSPNEHRKELKEKGKEEIVSKAGDKAASKAVKNSRNRLRARSKKNRLRSSGQAREKRQDDDNGSSQEISRWGEREGNTVNSEGESIYGLVFESLDKKVGRAISDAAANHSPELVAESSSVGGNTENSDSSTPDAIEKLWGRDRLSPVKEETRSRDIPPHLNTQVGLEDTAQSQLEPENPRKGFFRVTELVRGKAANIFKKVTKSVPVDDEDARIWKQGKTGTLRGCEVEIEKVTPLREMDVPVLAHGLDRVLFNPGVYWLRDPRSGIYNFDPRLKDVLDVDLFDYAALSPYITSSQDKELLELARRHDRKFSGSTSSMTGLLSQCYFLISAWRDPDTSGFTSPFSSMPSNFSMGARLPASVKLEYKDGRYAIDSDKSASGELENSNYVLTSLGKSMEKMLTSTPEEYSRYMRVNSWKLTEAEKNKPESYHYAKTSKLMMRSQLDCSDERLPRKTFDLKTRASVGVRIDRANYVEASGYQIRRATGLVESFEREYFDMVRAAFLKYNFQARIGHMDGIFVAYHNTSTIFGFQYISVEEMNLRLFGSEEMADQAFKLSLNLLEVTLEAATELFPNQSLKLTFETKPNELDGGLSVYVEPATPASSDDVSKEAYSDLYREKRLTADQAKDCAEDSSQPPPKRTIAQLDILVDRYLDGVLVRGPVDFSVLPGRRIDPMHEDEIARRTREKLPPVKWDIDYSISPRPDLSESDVRQNLNQVRTKQIALNSLTLPNVEALNERERYRQEQLRQNPEALRRFLEERASGVAPGMPLAPGQVSASDSVPRSPSSDGGQKEQLTAGAGASPTESHITATTTVAKGGDEAEPSPAEKRKAAVEMRWKKIRDMRTQRMRDLARLGAEDAKASSLNDKLELYERRG
ncbi:Pet127-domain-containing protein [Violaceomyces palustris]|uniref:Pet127-domain-containing protein n=1 Tax=Violaceomyces palustris TaxID=1673888 RepID=A0ACD0P7R2_9BASI|nr:Pet127-domain-containing protein [Violaceomyces palustris]